jgi:hypothetical protein
MEKEYNEEKEERPLWAMFTYGYHHIHLSMSAGQAIII